jgi:tRNA(adenine34) deaminase
MMRKATRQSGKASSAKTAHEAGRKWVSSVKTVSTFPPDGLFTKSAPTIARTLASKKVSPKGPTSGLRMLIYFINRGGKGLTEERRAELERAKRLMSERIHRHQQPTGTKRPSKPA